MTTTKASTREDLATDAPIRGLPVRERQQALFWLTMFGSCGLTLGVFWLPPDTGSFIGLADTTYRYVLIVIGLTLIGAAALKLHSHRTKARLAAIDPHSENSAGALERIIGQDSVISKTTCHISSRNNSLIDFARTLHRLDEPGRVWQLHGTEDSIDQLDGIDVYFEPAELSEYNRALQELMGLPDRRSDFISRGMFKASTLFGESRIGRIFGQVLFIIGMSILLFAVLLQIIESLNAPTLILPLLSAWSVAVLPQIYRSMWPTEWIVVPGAIVVRNSSWLQSVWNIDLYPRNESVMVYWESSNFLAVANSNGSGRCRKVTKDEAEAAMRAFLSPLPPPRVEALSDLT